MDNQIHQAFKVDDRSYFAIVKKEIHQIAVSIGFNEHRAGVVDIVIAELVTNLVKHGGGGEVWVKPIAQGQQNGIEIISVDNGKGIADVNKMISDGASSKNTLGQGLGSIKRLSDFFQIYSIRGWGTILLSRIYIEPIQYYYKATSLEIRSILLPKPGETACGDGYFCKVRGSKTMLFLGDGLGHGVEAYNAVTAAGDHFMQADELEPTELIRSINLGVRKTRGLVGTVAIYEAPQKNWVICGVGNIATKIVSVDTSKTYMSYNGIIGLNIPRTLSHQSIPFETGQYMIMCSDGLKTKWDLTSRYPGILRYDLSILIAALIKDNSRQTDDVSVVACKLN